MKIDFSDRVLDALEDAPPGVRKAFWQARVNNDWRFYFKIVGDTYRLEEIRRHPK
jgi:hypothetical protein